MLTALYQGDSYGWIFIAWETNSSTYRLFPVKTKHLYNICTMLDQRRRRWTDVVQMLYKCCVFAGSAANVL